MISVSQNCIYNYTNLVVPKPKGSLSHSSDTAHIKRLLLKAIIPWCHKRLENCPAIFDLSLVQ